MAGCHFSGYFYCFCLLFYCLNFLGLIVLRGNALLRVLEKFHVLKIKIMYFDIKNFKIFISEKFSHLTLKILKFIFLKNSYNFLENTLKIIPCQ